MLTLSDSAQYLKNVGPKRYRDLERLGVRTVRDLLYLFPRRHEDRTKIAPIGRLQPEETAIVRGRILSTGADRLKTGLEVYRVVLGDETGYIPCNWYNQAFLKDRFSPGLTLIVSGKVQYHGRGGLSLNVADYEILDRADTDPLNFNRIVPVYPLTGALTQRTLRPILRSALETFAAQTVEILPDALLSQLGLPRENVALEHIHFPPDGAALEKARTKLAFQEFLVFQLGVALAGRAMRDEERGIAHTQSFDLVKRFLRTLPFKLTEGQKNAMHEIRADMTGPRPMNRLVQGDVGCGKTLVALCSALIAAEGGYQTVLMAPTEALAYQHFLTLRARLAGLDVPVELLTGQVKGKKRALALGAAASGRAKILVGTHALLQEDVSFHRLGLCVVDEQHKFGVFQRAVLRRKGPLPDFLMMTATPIPRSLALTLFGDMDLSVIRDLPRGRKPVRTYWIGEQKLPDAYRFVAKQAAAGRQAYIIYPLIDESDRSQLKSATTMVETLRRDYLPGLNVGLLHGRMKAEDKNRVLDGFRSGSVQVLVSTTVVEVGIDVPNANLMLIENAERFGLSQLHQLRGRIGRGEALSYCVLQGSATTPQAVERLKTMEQTADGFRIAEKDLELRGPGEFFGSRQHGLPEFSVGDVFGDCKLMEQAKTCAQKLVAQDPALSHPRHALLREELRRKYGDRFHFMRG